jgi:hypothetical protein
MEATPSWISIGPALHLYGAFQGVEISSKAARREHRWSRLRTRVRGKRKRRVYPLARLVRAFPARICNLHKALLENPSVVFARSR